MNMEAYSIIQRAPTVEEYQQLREAVGWWRVNDKATKAGLNNALFSVCVTLKDEVIGCGRVVGDGGIYYYIQDVMVLPEYQRRGIGKRRNNLYHHQHYLDGSVRLFRK